MAYSRLSARLWRYVVLGILTNGLCYGAFLLLVAIGVTPVAANALCYMLGLMLGYVGNRRWAFRSENRHVSDMLRFGAAHVAGFASSIACISITMKVMPVALAQLVAIVVAAGIIFTVLQISRFGQAPRSREM